MFKRLQKGGPTPAAKPQVVEAAPEAPAPAEAAAPTPAPAPKAAKAPAKAENLSREERRKQRLMDLRLEMHTRLLENLNLGAIENAAEADLRREIAAICADGLQEMGMVLTKEERSQLN